VLWYERLLTEKTGSSPISLSWDLVNATATESRCETALQKKLEDVSRPEKDVKVEVKGNVVYKQSAGTLETFRYLCVPDTVDPRGPKGK